MLDTQTAETVDHDKDAEQQLWQRLRDQPDDALAWEGLLDYYRWVVQAELGKARARLPRHIDAEELAAAGQEALFLSIRSFQPERNLHFENYARTRIRGAMIDRVRALDGTPRTARRAAKTLARATQDFTKRMGRAPDMEELGREAGLSVPDLDRVIRRAKLARKLSLEAFIENENTELAVDGSPPILRDAVEDNPLHKMVGAEQLAAVVEALKQLPERERAIMVLHYRQGVMFTQIAAGMEVSESRVSQMHARALSRLRQYLTTRRMTRDDEEDDESS